MWRQICQVENFSTWERWRKSVMWRNFSTWERWRKSFMWRNLSAQPTFLQLNWFVISFSITKWIFCTICDVLSHFMLFCCKISLLSDLRYLVAKSVLSRFMHFGVEKIWAKNLVCGEKRTNIRYGQQQCLWFKVNLLPDCIFLLIFWCPSP